MDIKKAIEKVTGSKDLTEKEAYAVFDQIMSGKVTPAGISAFIVGLKMKGETVDEITGAVRVMREKAVKIHVNGDEVVDTCGTGGSKTDTFNISTATAFVLAGCGVKVAKHGNRAASSRCGSADVLEKLGVKIDVPPKVTEECIKRIDIGFMFAPMFHEAMKHAREVRKEIGVRTIFNILGPLCNPASSSCQILGVYEKSLTKKMAEVLKRVGTKRAFVVYGMDSLDEITITDKTVVSELNKGKIRTYFIDPKDFGLKKSTLADIKGGSMEENASIIRAILQGVKGPKRDIVLANTSVALVACGKAKNFKEGVVLAAASIDSGAAGEKLRSLVELTNA
ncbi:MAG: anthranilate phosphoribosyltransferase [Candidatus Omnitrophica bacterium]|nr:anthranilate phosphoribosyltransferase [Candidatus Omnitrophota bacterium]